MPELAFPIFVIFNLAVLVGVAFTCRSVSLRDILRDKSAPSPDDPKRENSSMSRLAGAIGSIVLAAFFWAIANVILVKTLGDPDKTAQVKELIDGIGSFFALGAALFAPYAFNQLGQLFKGDK